MDFCHVSCAARDVVVEDEFDSVVGEPPVGCGNLPFGNVQYFARGKANRFTGRARNIFAGSPPFIRVVSWNDGSTNTRKTADLQNIAVKGMSEVELPSRGGNWHSRSVYGFL